LVGVGFLLQAAYHYSTTELVMVGMVYAIGFGMIVAVLPILVIEVVKPAEQALGNGLQTMATGVVTTVVTTLCYVLLARHGRVIQGTQLYLDQGFKDGYYFAAGIAFLGMLASLLIPRLRALSEVEPGSA